MRDDSTKDVTTKAKPPRVLETGTLCTQTLGPMDMESETRNALKKKDPRKGLVRRSGRDRDGFRRPGRCLPRGTGETSRRGTRVKGRNRDWSLLTSKVDQLETGGRICQHVAGEWLPGVGRGNRW